MIYTVSGRLSVKKENFAVVDIAGVGMKLFLHRRGLDSLPPLGETVKFFSYLHVREDALELYGFQNEEELKLFELLNSVSGIGPKSALGILDVAPIKELTSAIKEGRADLMTRASGVGSKTAERIILELRNKVSVQHSEEAVKKMESDADIVETLSGLGYRKEEIKSALQRLPEGAGTGLEERLKAALKLLSRKN